MRRLLPSCRKTIVVALFGLACLTASCTHQRALDAAAHSEPVTATALVAQADGLYAERGSIERARQAAAVLRRARMADFSNYEAIWKLARCNYYLGAHDTDEQGRIEAFREGITAGEAAVKLSPNSPEGHFWLGANLGGRAKEQGPLYALSSVGDIRREMETVIRLDEGFQEGSAYLALGQLDLELPEMLGGDRKRAIEELERGLRFGADNALLRLRLAEAYYEMKRPADARAQASAILKMKPIPEYRPEYDEAAEGARLLLQRLG